MTMIMFNDCDDHGNCHCDNGNVRENEIFFTSFWKVCQSQTLRNFFMR